jgi:hypothetical protein
MKVKQIVALQEISEGQVFHVRTRSITYVITRTMGEIYISGHPKYCPDPVIAHLGWGCFEGDGFSFSTEAHKEYVHTSRVQYILKVTE